MTVVQFAAVEDAEELIRELTAEGFSTVWLPSSEGLWLLDVQPDDERVLQMVDVYGGWLPGDAQLPEA